MRCYAEMQDKLSTKITSDTIGISWTIISEAINEQPLCQAMQFMNC